MEDKCTIRRYILAKWLPVMFELGVFLPHETKTTCVCFGALSHDEKPTWDAATHDLPLQLVSSDTEAMSAMKFCRVFPKTLPENGPGRVTRWMGIRNDVPWAILQGPIIDITHPPDNLWALTAIYVAYRQRWLREWQRRQPPRVFEQCSLWNEAMSDAQKQLDAVVQPDKRLFVLLDACGSLSRDLCRLIEAYQLTTHDFVLR